MVNGEREARYAVEMATVIAGSAEELRRRPVLSDLIGTISPLVVDKDAIEAALVFAAAGVPVTWVTMPTLGTTAPATKAGAFALGSAELVAATVVLQLASPGRAGAALHDAELGGPAQRQLRQLPPRRPRADPGHGARAPLGRAGRVGRLRHRLAGARHLAGRRRGRARPRAGRAGGLRSDAQHRPRQRLHALLSRAPHPRRRHLSPGAVLGAGHRLRATRRSPWTRSPRSAPAGTSSATGTRGGTCAPPSPRRSRTRRDQTEPTASRSRWRASAALELWRDYRPEPLAEDKAAELARILAAADAELRG